MRRIAERLYFHRRNDAGIDREAYMRWIDSQAEQRPIAGQSEAR